MTGATPPEDAMRLRGDRRPVKRLSRRVVVLLGLVAGGTLGAALIYALGSRQGTNAPAELFSTDVRTTADGLAALPHDYGAVPQLGPPLPGDFGRAVLGQQGRPDVPPAVDPGEQQRRQDAAAADASKLFVGVTARLSPPAPAGSASGTAAALASRDAATDRHQALLEAPVDRRTTAPDRVSPPASSAVLQAGSVIAAALLTGIRSDLPGQVTAQVTEAVYDSPTGQRLLIPQGSRLIGQYQGGADAGQRRVLLVWTRLIRPDGSSIVLERTPLKTAAP